MNQLLIFLLFQFPYTRDFKLRKSLGKNVFGGEHGVGRGGNSIFFVHETINELFNRYANGNILYQCHSITYHFKHSPSPRCSLCFSSSTSVQREEASAF